MTVLQMLWFAVDVENLHICGMLPAFPLLCHIITPPQYLNKLMKKVSENWGCEEIRFTSELRLFIQLYISVFPDLVLFNFRISLHFVAHTANYPIHNITAKILVALKPSVAYNGSCIPNLFRHPSLFWACVCEHSRWPNRPILTIFTPRRRWC